jgi:hypothetical protein
MAPVDMEKAEKPMRFRSIDAYEMLRLGENHQTIFGMLRIYAGSAASIAARGDSAKTAELDRIHKECWDLEDESLNSGPPVREDVAVALKKLFAFLGFDPAVVIELCGDPGFPIEIQEMFDKLSAKFGIKFSFNYPGKNV